jgi:DNA-binding transcriptional regulator YhcF (GntR family)
MMTTPPARRITEELRSQILGGHLQAGDRVPSTRRIVEDYGVAMATASKVLAALQAEGLVQVRPGVGTIVRDSAAPGPELGRTAIVRSAIRIADAEGLDALSMRRVAADLGSAVMSLYRHVPSKEELELWMRDLVFGDQPLPAVAPTGWRPALEISARTLWSLYRRHTWLARTASLTRPYAGANQMPFSEWNLAALSGLGLNDQTVFSIHLSLFGFVHGSAGSLEAEGREEAASGVTLHQWLDARDAETRSVMTSGRFPNAARVFLAPGLRFDLDELYEFGLARFLDGVANLVIRTATDAGPA